MTRSKLISLLLVLAMLMSMLVLPVAAVEEAPEAPETPETPEATEPADCPEHPGAEWTEVAAADWAAGGALTTGHYRLTGNVDLTAALTVAAGQTVCIDLAGFNITASATTSNPYRVMENSGTLTVLDSVGTGVISGGYMYASSGLNTTYGGNIYNVENSVFNLYGGTISGGTAHRKYHSSTVFGGGNIYSKKGTVNIYGGTVTGGRAYGNLAGGAGTTSLRRTSMAGGNIYMVGGALTIKGGTVSNGAVENIAYGKGAPGTYMALGGNICAMSGTSVTITGGTISGGSVICNNQGVDSASGTVLTSYAYGGNIYMQTSSTTVTISGGTVSDGSVEASATAYGEGTITTTTVAYNGGNLYIASGSFEMTGGKVTGGSADLGGAIYSAGATTISGGKVTGGSADLGGAIYSAGATTISGGTVSGGTAATYGGNIYVDGTVNLQGNAVISGGTIPTDETSRRGGNIYIASGKTMNMKDDVRITGGVCGPYVTTEKEGAEGEEPTTETTGGKNARGGNVFVVGTFNMYSGTISDGFAGWGNNVMLQSGAVMNMYDGKITGGAAKEYSVFNQRGTVNIYGGTINETETGYEALVSTGTAETNGAETYIYGGNVASMLVSRKTNVYMFGGYVKSLVAEDAFVGTITVHNGIVDTSATITVADCAHQNINGTYYHIWHNDGACATCGHTFAAVDTDTACEVCSAVHETTGGLHSYEEGICSVCGYEAEAYEGLNCGCENPTWVAWDGVTMEDGGHYYLTDDLQLTDEAKLAVENGAVCIDLNGYTLTAAPGKRAFNLPKDVGCRLNIENGTVRGAGMAVGEAGGLIFVGTGAFLTGYDANFIGGITDRRAGGNFYINGEIYLSCCQILNGQVDNEYATKAADGGNFAIQGADAVAHLSTCKIAGGDVSTMNNAFGGNIYCTLNSTMVLEDSEVTGGRAIAGGNIYMMNGTAGGYGYIYGDTVIKDAHEDTLYGFYVYGSSSYISNLYVYGGYIEDIHDNGNENEIMLFNGTFGFDPRTANTDGSSMVGECACVSYDEETGLYTVSHPTAEYCDFCESYSRQHPVIYANVGGHTYTESNVCDSCGLVTAKIGDVEYTELTKALDAAEATDTVVLMRNVIAGDLNIYTTLDLNGFELKTKGIVDASTKDSHIVDSVGTGSVAADQVRLYETNKQLAVKVDGSYKFEDVSVKQIIEEVDATTKYLTFIIEDGAEDTYLDDILVNGDEFIVRITVTWNNGANVHHFNYTSDLVRAYGLDAEGNSVWGEKMFTCTINGLDEIGEHTITAEIMSEGTVVAAISAR